MGDAGELPAPGQVDFVVGGPPCQGYSGMNRFNKGNWSMVQNSMVRPPLAAFPPVAAVSTIMRGIHTQQLPACICGTGSEPTYLIAGGTPVWTSNVCWPRCLGCM